MNNRLRRLRKWLLWSALALAVLIISGLLLADHLMPPATGQPSRALPVQAAQSELDRQVVPRLLAHPGRTGVILLADGRDAFAARATTARLAGRSLDLQYYIWHDDLAGRLLGREVFKAAERGVRVRMLLDDMNQQGRDDTLLALDAHPNIEIRSYNPFRNRTGVQRVIELAQRIFSVNHRMHNKAWIADGRAAVIGGRNIGEEYFAAAAEVNFRDLDALLMGPAVTQAEGVFDEYWNSRAVVPIAALGKPRTQQALDALLARIASDTETDRAHGYLARVEQAPRVGEYARAALQAVWSAQIEVVADPPLKWQQDDQRVWLTTRLFDEIRAAQHKALLISPYFVPGEMGTDGLTALAHDGVAIGVITNSLAANDVYAVHSGYAEYRKRLLDAGVHLYEIRAGQPAPGSWTGSSGASLHTKAFVIDDRRGFIGSFNLDPRSANLNTEMGLLFDDPAVAAALREEYLRLAAPDSSYWVYRDRHGALRWLDRRTTPPQALTREPDTAWSRRAAATVMGWLPIESQL